MTSATDSEYVNNRQATGTILSDAIRIPDSKRPIRNNNNVKLYSNLYYHRFSK